MLHIVFCVPFLPRPSFFFFFFKDPAPTEISPLPLHDALPILPPFRGQCTRRRAGGFHESLPHAKDAPHIRRGDWRGAVRRAVQSRRRNALACYTPARRFKP